MPHHHYLISSALPQIPLVWHFHIVFLPQPLLLSALHKKGLPYGYVLPLYSLLSGNPEPAVLPPYRFRDEAYPKNNFRLLLSPVLLPNLLLDRFLSVYPDCKYLQRHKSYILLLQMLHLYKGTECFLPLRILQSVSLPAYVQQFSLSVPHFSQSASVFFATSRLTL